MKTPFTNKFALLAGLAILTATSCKKENADIADVTPTKEVSTTSTTPVVPVTPAQTVKTNTYTVSTWVFDKLTNEYQGYIIDPGITQDILNNGVVQVFVQASGNKYLPLPITSYEKLFTITYSLELNLVKIEMQYEDLGQGAHPGSLTFRIASVSNQFIKQHPDVDLKDYTKLSDFSSAR
jgi:hypothetical protein